MPTIKRITLDLSEADGYSITVFDVLQGALRENALYEEDHLYSVIDGDRLEEFLSKGAYRDDDLIFALTREQLANESDVDPDNNISVQLNQYENPAIAVYNAAHFHPRPIDVPIEEFQFKNPDEKLEALEGIVEVTW